MNPTNNYTYSYTRINTGICYCQAQTTFKTLYSLTLTFVYPSGDSIICEKNIPGTSAPDVASYIDNTLSCKIGSTEIP
jgi:hypothetical protein